MVVGIAMLTSTPGSPLPTAMRCRLPVFDVCRKHMVASVRVSKALASAPGICHRNLPQEVATVRCTMISGAQ